MTSGPVLYLDATAGLLGALIGVVLMQVECGNGEIFDISELWSRPRSAVEWSRAFGISLATWWRHEPTMRTRRVGQYRRLMLADCPPSIAMEDLGVRPVRIVSNRASIPTERI